MTSDRRAINKGLMEFIDQTPNAFLCADNIVAELQEAGYQELREDAEWQLTTHGRYYVVRNASSVIAFSISDPKLQGFNIVAAHGDSPSFSIKPGKGIVANGYLKLNVDRYGGMIYYSWLDRPLSVAGRVIVKQNGVYTSRTVNIDKDIMIIPSQAIHLNRSVNEKNELNPQVDLLPVMGMGNDDLKLRKLLEEALPDCVICDYELLAYSREKARYCGVDDDFIMAPRLDDLGSVYPALRAFIDHKMTTNSIYCCFNNEEIGSMKIAGADSTFMRDVLKRLCAVYDMDIDRQLASSMLVSADNGHAMHPNAPAKSDLTNEVKLNGGIVIKHHVNYTTDALSASVFRGICADAQVECQDFTCRSDLRCGATLGGISLSHVSVTSVDIGLPQLAMHSAMETIGAADPDAMYRGLMAFYQTAIGTIRK